MVVSRGTRPGMSGVGAPAAPRATAGPSPAAGRLVLGAWGLGWCYGPVGAAVAPPVRPGESRPDLDPAGVAAVRVLAGHPGVAPARRVAVGAEQLLDAAGVGDGPPAQPLPAAGEVEA